MSYKLKDKIIVTEEFLNELITKSWQDAEAIQQQIDNIDTSTKLGSEVARLLKNTCTNYYVFIGCLEALNGKESAEQEDTQELCSLVPCEDVLAISMEPEETKITSPETVDNFEPFEYFVDFDEPSGEPLSDQDLYS